MERISTVRKAPCWVLWGLCTPNADNLVPGRELKDGHLRWKQAYSPNPLRLVVRVVHVFIIPLLMRFDLADLAGCCSFPSPYLSDYPSQIWLTLVTVTVPAGGGLSFVQGVKVALLLRLRLSKRQSRESLKAGTNWSCDLSPGFMQSWSKKQKNNLWFRHHSRLNFLEIFSECMLEFDYQHMAGVMCSPCQFFQNSRFCNLPTKVKLAHVLVNVIERAVRASANNCLVCL